jgi:hypothetical protein
MTGQPGCPDDHPIAGCPIDIAEGPDPRLAPRLERAARRFHLQGAHNVLDEALTALPPPVLVREVVGPVLRRLHGDGEEGAARFAASLVEVRLLAQGRGWESLDGPPTVLACAPREEYVLELIGLGLTLADRGHRISYLGAATPTSVLRQATRDAEAAAVLVSAEQMDLRPREVMQLSLIARDVPVLTTGLACAEVAGAIGAHALPDDPGAAVAMLAGIARRRSSRRSDGGSSHPP